MTLTSEQEKIFKAYDIRGLYGTELNDDLAYKIGRAFVKHLNCKTVVVGRDMRISSDAIFKSLTWGIMDQGANVIDIGLSSTPMMYYVVAFYGYDAGIQITASHNPKEYNGFKLVKEKAIPLSNKTGIHAIRDLIKADDLGEVQPSGKMQKKERIVENYILNEMSVFHDLKDTSKLLKIVIDASNAMAGIIAEKFFRELNCRIYPLYFDLDGNFPNHEANPMKEENLRDLKNKVLEEKADIGIAFDGDADRVVFVDEKGETIRGDYITALVAKALLEKHPEEKILYDIRSSRVVKEYILENKGIPISFRIGHSFIKQKMREEGILFAGEMSSHFFFKKNFNFESPFAVAGIILSLLSKSGKKLSELVAPLKKYYQTGELNFEVQNKDNILKKIEFYYPDGKISHVDGLTVEFDDWWFNLRPSNTEPVIRLNLEASSPSLLEQKKEEVKKLIEEYGK